MDNEQFLKQFQSLLDAMEQRLLSNQHLQMLETSHRVSSRMELSLAATELRKMEAESAPDDHWLAQRMARIEKLIDALDIRLAKIEARRKPEDAA